MGDFDVIPLVDEGLGNSAYLLDLDDGRALAVDASRDLRALHDAARRRGLTVAYAADTHLHADFLTGAVHLARTDGAQVLASARGNREYPHTGLVDGGLDSWTAADQPTRAIPVAGREELNGARVLDIRQRAEFQAGHVPGAVNIELGALASQGADLPDEPWVVMCGHGERAMGAASLLARSAHHHLTVLGGGPQDWAGKTASLLESDR